MVSSQKRMKSAIARAFDKRREPRIPIQLKVDVESPNNHYLFEYSTNLSQNGIFIQTTEPEEPGTLVNIQFTLPNNQVIRTRGEVIWVNSIDSEEEEEPGMGVKFIGISDDDRDSILAALKKLAIL